MADDTISRQAAIEAVEKATTKECARWVIKEIPPVDVAPVVHAHWKLNKNRNHYTCSNCGTFAAMWFDDDGERIEWLSDYCPNCGAKMDEGESE